MRNSNFEQKLQEWANETADFYHEMAMSYNLAFYTQSDLNKVSEQAELLILGINPGSAGTYINLQESNMWKDWGVNGRMDGTTLLKGNPSLSNKDSWRIWQGLKRVFSFGGITDILNDESKYAWSNIIFFNEPKEKNIRKELYQLCPEKTFELIRILKPKRILCLSIRKCFSVLGKEIKDHEVLIDSFLERGKLLNIPIYGIRHTSYGNAGEKVVGKCLKHLFANEYQREVSKEEITMKFAKDIAKMKEKRNTSSKKEVQEILNLSFNKFKTKWRAYDDHKCSRFEIANGKLSLTVTASEKGYIGIRFRNKDKVEDSLVQSDIISTLQKYGFQPYRNQFDHLIWLGLKRFNAFDGNNPQEISENIISELDNVIAELENLRGY